MHEMNRRMQVGCIAFALLLSAGVGMAQNTIPWNDTFETGYTNSEPLNGNNGWTASAGAKATTDESYAGSYSAYIPADDGATNFFASGNGYTNVWTDMYTVPHLWEGTNVTRDIASDATVAFYFDSNGYPVVNSGPLTNWLTKTVDAGGGALTAIQTGQWARVTVLSRYGYDNWALIVNDTLVAEGLGFYQGAAEYDSFSVSEGDTYLDNVWVGLSEPDGTTAGSNPALTGDVNGNGFRDAFDLNYFGTTAHSYSTDGDEDGDGWTNVEENDSFTDPFDSGDAPEQVTVPYWEPFDALANGTIQGKHGWSTEATNSLVQSTVKFGPTGKSLQLGDGDTGLTNVANVATYTNVWFDMVLQSGNMDWQYTPDPDTTVAFYTGTNGYVKAFDHTNQVELTQFLGGAVTSLYSTIPVGQWTRFIANADYGNSSWSLWIVPDALNSNNLARLVARDLDFYGGSAPRFTGLTINNVNGSGHTGYVDNVRISLDMSEWVDSDGDGVPDHFEVDYGMDEEDPADDTNADGESDYTSYVWGTTGEVAYVGHVRSADLETAAGDDILVDVIAGAERDIALYGSSSHQGPWTLLRAWSTGSDGSSNTYTHGGIVGSAAHYFYRTMSSFRGSSATDVVDRAWYRQARASDSWYLCSVPVAYMSGSNNLNSALGQHLARGLSGGAQDVGDDLYLIDASGAWEHYYLNASGVWVDYTTGSPVSRQVDAGTAMWVRRRSGAAGRSNSVFAGMVRTGAQYSVTLNAGWNLVGWPHHSGSDSSAADFLAAGGSGSTTETGSDHAWMLDGSRWLGFRLLDGYGNAYDGEWYRISGGSPGTASFDLEIGEGFYYEARGTAWTWRATSP